MLQIENPVGDDEVHIENISSIITIVIASIGITFNILNIIISSRKPSKASLHIYLVALSIVDLLYLVCVLPSRAFRCGSACPSPAKSVSTSNKQYLQPLFAITETLVRNCRKKCTTLGVAVKCNNPTFFSIKISEDLQIPEKDVEVRYFIANQGPKIVAVFLVIGLRFKPHRSQFVILNYHLRRFRTTAAEIEL